jgi:hypothetical protein
MKMFEFLGRYPPKVTIFTQKKIFQKKTKSNPNHIKLSLETKNKNNLKKN